MKHSTQPDFSSLVLTGKKLSYATGIGARTVIIDTLQDLLKCAANSSLGRGVEYHDFPARYQVYGQQVRRIAFGELMPQAQRKTFPRCDTDPEPLDSLTGSIGFMDLIRYPLAEQACRKPRDTALAVLSIGIEPEHQHKGYFPRFVGIAEEVARQEGHPVVLMENVNNDRAYSLLVKMAGYSFAPKEPGKYRVDGISPLAGRHLIKWL